MTDTEKAISLLQQCLDERPYAAVRVSQIMSCIQEAVELLKEQEPVKPIRLENWWKCPSCSGNIVANMKYCPGCGKAVKWE